MPLELGDPLGISAAESHSARFAARVAGRLRRVPLDVYRLAVAYSFGAFVNPITNEFHASRAAVSAVFSVTAFIYFLVGSVTGLLADRFGPRPGVVAGALLMGAGLALTSRIHDLSMSYLTYTIGVGAGVACGYVPMVAAVSGWFIRRRNTALGIAVAGIGFGTIVGAPLAAKLIALYGWRATYLLFSASSTFLLLLVAVFAHKPPASRITSGTTTGEALRTPAFAVLWVSSFLCSVPLFVPFVFCPRLRANWESARLRAPRWWASSAWQACVGASAWARSRTGWV